MRWNRNRLWMVGGGGALIVGALLAFGIPAYVRHLERQRQREEAVSKLAPLMGREKAEQFANDLEDPAKRRELQEKKAKADADWEAKRKEREKQEAERKKALEELEEQARKAREKLLPK